MYLQIMKRYNTNLMPSPKLSYLPTALQYNFEVCVLYLHCILEVNVGFYIYLNYWFLAYLT